MTLAMLAACLAALVVAIRVTDTVRRHAIRSGIIDRPNERSSHLVPTPRGGGLAIVVTFASGAVAAGFAGWVPWPLVVALLLPGLAVACVGWLDDHGHVPHLQRLAVHLVAIALGLAVLAVGGDGASRSDPQWSPLIVPIVWLGCGWFLNLFNFMDGIDGIAASEAVFVAVSAGVLLSVADGASGLSWLWALLAACGLGFLRWNWPPARIFMGDVGSGFLGCTLALMLVASDLYSMTFSSWTGLALVAPFVADATTTLLRRILRGERWHSAHREHAYQWLARRWHGHAPVTGVLLLFNLAVVLPLAWATTRWSEAAPVITVGGVLVCCGLAWAAGAGTAVNREPAFERPAAGHSDS